MKNNKKKNCKCCLILSIIVVILSSYIAIDIFQERVVDNMLNAALDDNNGNNEGYVYDESDFLEEHNKILEYKRNNDENNKIADNNTENKDNNDTEKSSNNNTSSNKPSNKKPNDKTADDKIKEAKDSVSFKDKAKALTLLAKLKPSDISMLKTMMSGGVSPEEKEKAKKLALKKFTKSELETIKVLYNKYKGLLD